MQKILCALVFMIMMSTASVIDSAANEVEVGQVENMVEVGQEENMVEVGQEENMGGPLPTPRPQPPLPVEVGQEENMVEVGQEENIMEVGQPENIMEVGQAEDEVTVGVAPQYVGCYKDDGSRDFKHGPKKYGYDKHSCQKACPQYKYFALQNGGWCTCDNTFSTPATQYPKVADSQCGTKGGSWRNMVYKNPSECSADNYLHFDGIPQKPTEIQSGIVDTGDCDLGFKFEGNANSVIKYDQINLAGHDQFTFTGWVLLDDFQTDVGLFTYGTYTGQCGFMCQLRVSRSNKDFHLRIKSTEANSFGQYNSNQGIFTNAYINKWFHVAVVKDVNTIYYYLDGEQVGSKPFSDVISDCDDHFQLGRWIEGGLKVVDGNTKQIKLFTTAKSQDDVRKIMNGEDTAKAEQALSKTSTVGGGTTQTSLGSHMSIAKFLAISTLLGGVVVFSMMMKTKESEEYDPLLESI